MKPTTFIKKAVTYIPRHLYLYAKDGYVKNAVLRCMKNPDGANAELALRNNICRRLKNAYKNVPYYSQFTQIASVTPENVFDVLSTLPLLSKDIIREQGARMRSRKIDVSCCGKGSTGGTTGKPLEFYRSPPSTEFAHQMALYEYMTGIPYRHHLDKPGRIVSFGGVRPTEEDVAAHKFWTASKPTVYGSLDFCTLYMSEENLGYYIEELSRIKPYIIRGYSNAILRLAKYIEAHHIALSFAPKGIYVTSEHCSRDSILFISKAFKCNVFGQYGQTEACLFAWTRPNDDTYYCSPYYGYVEVVDEQGKSVAPGESGEVVVTAFGSDVMPFIRYRTGDIVRYGGIVGGGYLLTLCKEGKEITSSAVTEGECRSWEYLPFITRNVCKRSSSSRYSRKPPEKSDSLLSCAKNGEVKTRKWYVLPWKNVASDRNLNTLNLSDLQNAEKREISYNLSSSGLVFLSELQGRKSEYIVTYEGVKIPAVGIVDIHYLTCKDSIIQYQIEQNVPGACVFRLMVTDGWQTGNEKEIEKLFSINNIAVAFEYVKAMPLTKNGKLRAIIQNVI